MSKRQIIHQVLSGGRPPYVPWSFGFTKEAKEKLQAHYGQAELEDVLQNHLLKLGSDIGFSLYERAWTPAWKAAISSPRRTMSRATCRWKTCWRLERKAHRERRRTLRSPRSPWSVYAMDSKPESWRGEMNVVRLHGVGDLRLHAEPIPIPTPGESLLRVTAVGVCGSDLHWFAESGIGDARLDSPLILGHEFAGMIEEGDRVAADPAIPCLTCEFCLEGNPNLCEKLRFAGHGAEDGALRECVSWPARCLYPLPDSLSDADGALLEPLGVAIHAVDLAHLKPGMSVGIFGCGPIGLLTLQVARAAGATQIIATDKLTHRLDAARAMGATQVFLSHEGGENAEVWAATGGRGVHVAFECAGENAAVETSVAAARPGGGVILVGIPADDWTGFTASIARRKGLTLKLCRRMKHAYPRAIRLVEQGLIDLRSLVTHRFPLEQAVEAFATAQRREGIKIIIQLEKNYA